MKVAYLILAHKHPEQLKRLVVALNYGDVCFFIHVDKKSKINRFIIELKNAGINNFFFIPSQKINWASISQTEARLRLLNEAFKSNENFDYFVMLSGQSYPIKPPIEFLQFLNQNTGSSFIEYAPLPDSNLSNGGLDRINCYTYFVFGKAITYYPSNYYTNFNLKGKLINSVLKLLALFKKERTFPTYLKPFHGIDWWVLYRDAVDYLLDFVQKNNDYHFYHKHTRHACEVYFPSIFADGRFKGKIQNNSLHYMKWDSTGFKHPYILKKNDFEDLNKTDAFFARKFDQDFDKEILDLIDKKLLLKNL